MNTNYTISAVMTRVPNGKFKPGANLHFHFGDKIVDRSLGWDIILNTEEEAKTYAIRATEEYLKNEGYTSAVDPISWLDRTSLNSGEIKV